MILYFCSYQYQDEYQAKKFFVTIRQGWELACIIFSSSSLSENNDLGFALKGKNQCYLYLDSLVCVSTN